MTRVQLSRFTVVLWVLLSLFAVSCKKPAPPPPAAAAPPTPTPPTPAPVITLRSDRTTIERGEGVTLSWEARNAATVRVEPGLGEVSISGNQQVSPVSSVTYTATAVGPGGTATDNARITVNVPAAPAARTEPTRPAPTLSIDQLLRENVQPILFDYDQAEIRADQINRLQSNATWFKQNATIRFTVEGHADERGSQEYNLGLGDRRANAVKQYLMAQGIPEGRMNVVSFGEERPECRETTEACYARNRRVAFAAN